MKKKIFYSLLTLVSIQFLVVGVLKVIDFSPLYQQLAELNISKKMGFTIGILEILGVVGIWVSKTRGLALLGLLYIVISAIAVHFGAHVELSKALPTVISCILLCTILYLNNSMAIKSIVLQDEHI